MRQRQSLWLLPPSQLLSSGWGVGAVWRAVGGPEGIKSGRRATLKDSGKLPMLVLLRSLTNWFRQIVLQKQKEGPQPFWVNVMVPRPTPFATAVISNITVTGSDTGFEPGTPLNWQSARSQELCSAFPLQLTWSISAWQAARIRGAALISASSNRLNPYARPIRARWANDNPGSRCRAIPAAP